MSKDHLPHKHIIRWLVHTIDHYRCCGVWYCECGAGYTDTVTGASQSSLYIYHRAARFGCLPSTTEVIVSLDVVTRCHLVVGV